MNIAIVDYNSGNIRSVLFAMERLGINGILTSDPELLQSADKVIFPGVGEAGSAMSYLKERGLDQRIISLKQPVLGICLGMQLLCRYSEEGDTRGIGVFPVDVRKFNSITKESESIKIPHTGWNTINDLKSPLFSMITENTYMYFVHSYYAEACVNTISTTDYIVNYSSALQKDNFYGVQFHPEKSGDAGQKLLENFIKL